MLKPDAADLMVQLAAAERQQRFEQYIRAAIRSRDQTFAGDSDSDRLKDKRKQDC